MVTPGILISRGSESRVSDLKTQLGDCIGVAQSIGIRDLGDRRKHMILTGLEQLSPTVTTPCLRNK